ncbi:hypothetical protein PI124_g23635 [Phytophthora idaei]|nr:hypothetical protein PI125_g25877 [Phytophthora idaei]KAG3123498.1 hypothetical protein PI126_g23678 [Phytophthora idaei]KAG3231270.1 hypothetical protein PI124_g23635 [Phytophthora idaei]
MARGDTDYNAARLKAEVEERLSQQQTEEEVKLFVAGSNLRKYVKAEMPANTVFFFVSTCVLAVDRLPNNRGTRIVFVDSFLPSHLKSYNQKLEKMNMFRKDAHVFKDPRCSETPRIALLGNHAF